MDVAALHDALVEDEVVGHRLWHGCHPLIMAP
jgi:hypothetical protein